MTNKNTMRLSLFLYNHLYWNALLLFFGYTASLFRPMGVLNASQSKHLLWALVLLGMLLGIALTYQSRRNYLSVFVNVTLPYELYALLAFREKLPLAITLSLIFAAFLSLGYIYLVATTKIQNGEARKRITHKRVRQALLGTRTLVSLSLTLVLACLFTGTVFDYPILHDTVKNDTASEWTVSNRISDVCLFTDDTWPALSPEEKLYAMQVIANIECNYLGLPYSLTIEAATLPEHTLGAYSHRTHSIQINEAHIAHATPTQILDSVCHEAYHAYQHALCDAYDNIDESYRSLLMFYEVPFYKQEFSDYISGEEDYLEYQSQHCETQARAYATEAVHEYSYRIAQHLQSQASRAALGEDHPE